MLTVGHVNNTNMSPLKRTKKETQAVTSRSKELDPESFRRTASPGAPNKGNLGRIRVGSNSSETHSRDGWAHHLQDFPLH